jgi:hypothetical protein
MYCDFDCLCGLVVRVLGYRFGGPGSIPGTTSFSGKKKRKKVVGLERGPLSLVSTTEELLDKKSSGSCLENREFGRRDPSRWPRGTLYPQKLATTSARSGGRSVGIVRSRTQTMEFFLFSWNRNTFKTLELDFILGNVLPITSSQCIYQRYNFKYSLPIGTILLALVTTAA